MLVAFECLFFREMSFNNKLDCGGITVDNVVVDDARKNTAANEISLISRSSLVAVDSLRGM